MPCWYSTFFNDTATTEIYTLSLHDALPISVVAVSFKFFFCSLLWPMSGTFEEVPPFATLLRPKVLHTRGGNPEFVNTYAAYADLPEDEKAWLDTLKVVHT